ncbi:hypothetical protein TVAG_314900 [Trichomonas vaginalis G3]|uniref:Glycosyltransferase 61 catalytic domain-containing protein n=1 Tax=Trichomonas vaginalis (strain ATCC PRA-98 / G3) TaxID=412133 RepID=A2ETS9_TRIV3|nr:glycosyltransferase family [Trichomonas vaginalis G3]EAY03960.1 hypothetical protein TVAG_314900 [Trichomonas vaginalis G3]KAI5541021.1 glycosyltransferase family [Trichomonas vaginalis G3]|eukprot:XP_001316183.1 hypothetical protein [Trichomonas vaginalis G3]
MPKFSKIYPIRIVGTINKIPKSHILFKSKYNSSFLHSSSTIYHVTLHSPSLTDSYNSNAKNLDTHFFVLTQVYVNAEGGMVFDNKYYEYPDDPSSLFSHRNHAGLTPVKYHIHELINVGYGYCKTNFGHCIEDFFTPLLMIPEYIRQSSKILVNSLPSITDELFELFGIKNENRVYINANVWMSVDKVYIIAEKTHFLSIYGMSTLNLKRFFHEKFELDKIRSSRYCYSNRGYMKPRYIHNLDELMEKVSKKWPNIKWEFVPDNHSSVRESAKEWKTIKLIFCPIGSNVAKAIFMEDNSVVVTPTSERTEWSISQYCVACLIFEIQFDALKGDHLIGNGSPVDINLSLKMIEAGLYCVENHCWPQSVF